MSTFNFTGAALFHRAASGGMMGWATQIHKENSKNNWIQRFLSGFQ